MGEFNLIAKIRVQNDRNLIPAIAGFVGQLAEQRGLGKDAARQLEAAAEEACLNVVEHAFAPGTKDFFEISVEKRPGRFVVAIEDRGLPLDWKALSTGQGAGMGMTLIKAFTDEARFVNLGRQGKRLELVKLLSSAQDAAMSIAPMNMDFIMPNVQYKLQPMRPDEGIKLAKCIYKSFGYAYEEDLYFPEKIKELLESGLQYSIVAVMPDGEFLSHMAIIKDKKDSKTGYIGRYAMAPSYRGNVLLGLMKKQLLDYACSAGMLGVLSEAIAVEPETQRTNIQLGGIETAILLGQSPLKASSDAKRKPNYTTSVLFYFPLNDAPERTVYAPFHHKTMLARIYERAKLKRKFDAVAAQPEPAKGYPALVQTRMVSADNAGFISVEKYGDNLSEMVEAHLNDLCRKQVNCVFLDLPLSEPETSACCGALEMLGFFFSGVVPETERGDLLRLQFINHITINPAEAVLASDYAKDLLKYVAYR